jgi:acetyltransferase
MTAHFSSYRNHCTYLACTAISAPNDGDFQMTEIQQKATGNIVSRARLIDYDREMALVAEQPDSAIAAVGRLIRQHGESVAGFALVVGDRSQKIGLGAELLHDLLEVARREAIGCVVGAISADNSAMLELCRNTGFRLQAEDAGMVRAEIDI